MSVGFGAALVSEGLLYGCICLQSPPSGKQQSAMRFAGSFSLCVV